MPLWKKPAPAAGTPAAAGLPARRVERHPARAAIRTPLGKVIDLSSGGARIRCEAKPAVQPQDAVPLVVSLPGSRETVNARVCWVRRCGLLKGHWEVGLKFIAVPAAQQKRLGLIAEKGFAPPEEETPAPAAATPPRAAAGPGPTLEALRPRFEELGLGVEATAEEVRLAHRTLVRSCHPDVAPGEEAQQRFLRLQASYQAIVDALHERESRLADAA